jgi:hypothetical protein
MENKMSAFSSQWYDYQDQAAVAVSCWRISGPNSLLEQPTARAGGSDSDAAMFGDVDQAAVLAVAKARTDLSPVQLEERLGTSEALVSQSDPGAILLWRHVAAGAGSWRSRNSAEPGCLVVVRQPLTAPDPAIQRDWVRTVLRALETDPAPAPGLCSATFFATLDGSHVLNLAGWTSAEAHRAALRRGSVGQHGSIGITPEWAATRAHPGIQPEHEVRRFELLGGNSVAGQADLSSVLQPS